MVWERARAAKEKFEAVLLGKRHVVGVGVGKKVVGGKETGEPSVVVFVDKKVPNSELPRKDRVPETVGGVKTDVIETGEIRALGASLADPISRTARIRPAPGGVSIGHIRTTAGTLGAMVRRGGDRLILSNNHVVANSNAASRGDAILQPGPADGGTASDQLAVLEAFVPIAFDEPAAAAVSLWRRFLARLGIVRRPRANAGNRIDGALARPLRESDLSDDLLDIGVVAGTADAPVGARIRKSGRTTGLTEGRIIAAGVTVRVSYGTRVATFRDQLVAGPMSAPGDSGSIAVDPEARAVGLLFAGSDRTTVFNPIRVVTEAFGLQW